jgi:Fur family transcriptional regulator, peroxide stress response regulator
MKVEHVARGSVLDPDAAEALIKQSGHRMTAQRRAVIDILHNNRSHPDAEEIIAQVRSRLGCVSQGTIYNTLETLEKMGVVRRVEGLERQAHFDPDTSDHQHAICRKCGHVWDVDSPLAHMNLPDEFVVESILVRGLCRNCVEQSAHSHNKSEPVRKTKEELKKDEMAM